MQTDWDKLRPILTEAIGTTVYLVLVTFVVGGLIGLALGTALYTCWSTSCARSRSSSCSPPSARSPWRWSAPPSAPRRRPS
ncbi:Uncharacterised protein [Mycobacteroides abscessus subsp. abscessus]|nr:Uncharacterised protein [Mycobacteroides abscessus subsp. abscessus]